MTWLGGMTPFFFLHLPVARRRFTWRSGTTSRAWTNVIDGRTKLNLVRSSLEMNFLTFRMAAVAFLPVKGGVGDDVLCGN